MNGTRDRLHERLEDVELDDTPSHAWPEPIDLAAMLSREPSPPKMILEGVPAGYATLFAGHGGSGKSSIVLHLACCIATGRDWFGQHVEQRRVLYLSAEDRADVLHWRLARIAAHEGFNAAELDSLRLVDLVGHDSILFRRTSFTGAGVTAAYGELERLIAETRAEVLVVDGVSDTFGGNENDRADVKQFVNALVRLMGNDGAVILIHHVAKAAATASSTSEGYSGSTGWHNSVRARWYLYPETEHSDEGTAATGRLILTLQKSNLGRSDFTLRLKWDDDAHLFVAESGETRFDEKVRDTTERRGLVEAIAEVVARGDYVPAAAQGQRTAYHVLSACAAFPATLKNRTAKRRFWRHIETLRANSTLREGSIYAKHRRQVATLELQTREEPSHA